MNVRLFLWQGLETLAEVNFVLKAPPTSRFEEDTCCYLGVFEPTWQCILHASHLQIFKGGVYHPCSEVVVLLGGSSWDRSMIDPNFEGGSNAHILDSAKQTAKEPQVSHGGFASDDMFNGWG